MKIVDYSEKIPHDWWEVAKELMPAPDISQNRSLETVKEEEEDKER